MGACPTQDTRQGLGTDRVTFAHRAALARHFDGAHAALPADGGHAVGLAVDALAERAVVLPPPVSVGADLTVGIAAGGIIEGIHWI